MDKKTNKVTAQVINGFLEVIQDDEFTLKWQSMFNRQVPVNGKTDRPYNGINAFLINYLAFKENRFKNDNRFYTFKQANELGYKIKKGSKSVPIEYTLLYKYNEETRKYDIPIDYDKYNKMDNEEKSLVTYRTKIYNVFNAECIEELELKTEKQMNDLENDKENKDILKSLEKTIKDMGINIDKNILTKYPCYTMSNNTIVMPQTSQYSNYTEYIKTLCHELVHSTGVTFDRECFKNYDKDIKQRAKEELIAEIGSSLILQKLNVSVSNDMMNNAKAYIKSWSEYIKNEPYFLFDAVKQAEKTSQYIVEKYQSLEQSKNQEHQKPKKEEVQQSHQVQQQAPQQKPKPPIAKKNIPYNNIHSEKLRNINIVDYCNGTGIELIKKGSQYYVKNKDSISINEDKNVFFRHSNSKGGDVISFVQEYHEIGFKEALEELNNFSGGLGEMRSEYIPPKPKIEVKEEEKELILPEKTTGKFSNVYAYLCNKRGIDKQIINDLVKSKQLYQDTKYNVVFVSYDENNKPVYGFKRSTGQDFNYKGDCRGSDKSTSFFIKNSESTSLFITESIIDSLSIATILNDNDKNYKDYNYLSLGGTSTKALETFLSKNNNIKTVFIATDNDVPGLQAREHIKEFLKDKHPDVKFIDKVSVGKDFNEDLTKIKEKQIKKTINRKRENTNEYIR